MAFLTIGIIFLLGFIKHAYSGSSIFKITKTHFFQISTKFVKFQGKVILKETVKLNIGGTNFVVLKSTLTRPILKESYGSIYFGPNIFASILNGSVNSTLDENGALFFDRNPKYFHYILGYLRSPLKFELPEDDAISQFVNEVKFYKIDGLMFLDNPRSTISPHSSILTVDQAKDLMILIEFPLFLNAKLLYRATRDGFLARNFHSKCDNIQNTLTIIKSSNGNIFGGFTTAKWDSNYGYKKDECAFVFSLVNEFSLPLKLKISNNGEKAISCGLLDGPTFGEGHDFKICDKSNVELNSYSDFGTSYRSQYFVNGTEEANNLLAGSYKFLVKEIEVFALLL